MSIYIFRLRTKSTHVSVFLKYMLVLEFLDYGDFCYCTLKRVDFFSRNFENHNYSQINQSDLWNSVTQLGERKTCKYLVQGNF